MRVLTTVSSRSGSTQESGERIVGTLSEHGLEVEFMAASEVDRVSGYHAVLMGGAVYLRRDQSSTPVAPTMCRCDLMLLCPASTQSNLAV